MDEAIKYSIIVLTCDGGLSHTIRCLESLVRFAPRDRWELIVVDQGTQDGTQAWLQSWGSQHQEHVVLVRNKQRDSFAKGCNLGSLVARGERLVFLNNDVIVTDQWLERLETCLVETKSGMVGPMASNANGRQLVGVVERGAGTDQINAAAQQWHADHLRQWEPTGILYGFCLMVTRELWDRLADDGGWDERFVNGWEDNDLCLRAQRMGYPLTICGDVFVHHVGQATLLSLGTVEDYGQLGIKNQQLFEEKWRPSGPQKLVAVMRVANSKRTIQRVLDRTAMFADAGIIVHLCRNTCEETERIVRAHPKVLRVGVYDGPFQEDYERNWLLQEALVLQAEGKADWCISVDADELYEMKFVKKVQQLMAPRNPHISAYWCQWKTIWKVDGDREWYRSDGIFGGFQNYRFFRLLPGQRIVSDHPEGHHCGSAPQIPPENLGWANIRVKHLGYETPEIRQAKHAFYTGADHFKSARDIGNADYHHLVDDNVHLRRYREDQGISAVLLCRDEWGYLRGLLRLLEPLVDEFVIVVDDRTTDETLTELPRFAARSPADMKVFVRPWPKHYARARNWAIRQATRPWILHMDPDEMIEGSDIQVLARMVDEDVDGYLFPVVNYLEPWAPTTGRPAVYAMSESVRLYRNVPDLFYTCVIHETLEDALAARGMSGGKGLLMSPVKIHHRGYLRPQEYRQRKFEMYAELSERQLAITQGRDPRAYFNLALHYYNDGRATEALATMRQAYDCPSPKSWRIVSQLATLHFGEAIKYLEESQRIAPEAHPFKGQAEELLTILKAKGLKTQKV
jgi:GT2 family glycosyltransferase